MNAKKFETEVNAFLSLYCNEYMRNVEVDFDFSKHLEPRATIKLTDYHDYIWELSIITDGGNEIGIDIGDGGMLTANGEGLYYYLWHEAKERMRRIEDKPKESTKRHTGLSVANIK